MGPCCCRKSARPSKESAPVASDALMLTSEITALAKLYYASAVLTKGTMYRTSGFISSTVTAPGLLKAF